MNKSVHLVFTIALKQELPMDYIKDNGLVCVTLSALKSGKWAELSHSSPGFLLIITGPGPEHSKKAAEWIKAFLKPLYVVNIGTAANLTQAVPKGTWVSPKKLTSENAEDLDVADRFPFPLPPALQCQFKGILKTLQTPFIYSHIHEHSGIDFVDMEAKSQGDVFSQTETSFHVLKMVSDFGNMDSERDFEAMLPKCREDIKCLLASFSLSEPSISVVIPTYNRSQTILKCVESVFNQTLKPKEIIVVDDASTDDTVSVLTPHNSKLNVMVLSQNIGVSGARNIGINAAKGRWVALLDSDDTWAPEKLASQWTYLTQYPFYQWVQSKEKWIRNDEVITPKVYHAQPEGWCYEKSIARCLISPSSVMIKKDLLGMFGLFDEELPACEDYDLWLRVTRHLPIGLDPTTSVTKYGGHSDQLSQRFQIMDSFRVNSLLKALTQEPNLQFRALIIKNLKERLRILSDGCEKRHKWEQAKSYQKMRDLIPIA
ncbi:MAG: glycosyltransferase [Candidatus Margulisbacteria bacterium]|nr:glycosyltransferase [Candidatus Margulisiibacteriota bacterium]